jgi:hypothetical protein
VPVGVVGRVQDGCELGCGAIEIGRDPVNVAGGIRGGLCAAWLGGSSLDGKAWRDSW